MSPFKILFGKNPDVFGHGYPDIQKAALQKSAQYKFRSEKYYNINKNPAQFFLGPLVLFCNFDKRILDPEFLGPGVVLNEGIKGTYKIWDGGRKQKINCKDLKLLPKGNRS